MQEIYTLVGLSIPLVQHYVTVARNLRQYSIYCNARFWRKPTHLMTWHRTTSEEENVFSSGSALYKDTTEEEKSFIKVSDFKVRSG